jgi:hypothetical protein
MPTFNRVFNPVQALVETYEANESYYLGSQYQEVEAHRDFIDRLIMALGWDVEHHHQKKSIPRYISNRFLMSTTSHTQTFGFKKKSSNKNYYLFNRICQT